MRILHTSDWHLGRSFHGEDLLAAQAAYVDHLIETVAAEEVDLVVVVGRRLRPGAAAGRRGGAGRRDLRPARGLAGAHRGDQRQPRLAAAARVQLAAGRPRRGAPAHRPPPGRRAGAARRRRTARWPSTACPTSSPTCCCHAWSLPARSHQAALAHAMTAVRNDLADRPRHPLGRPRPRLRGRQAAAQRQRARHRCGRRLDGPRLDVRRASTTPRWATCTAARD